MSRAELTIHGVPAFRYDLARQSRAKAARARAMVPEGDDICCWTLVDKCGERPPVEHWWSREREGYKTPDQAFGTMADERRAGAVECLGKTKGGQPVHPLMVAYATRMCDFFAGGGA